MTEMTLAPKMSFRAAAVNEMYVLFSFVAKSGIALMPLISVNDKSITRRKPSELELVLSTSV